MPEVCNTHMEARSEVLSGIRDAGSTGLRPFENFVHPVQTGLGDTALDVLCSSYRRKRISVRLMVEDSGSPGTHRAERETDAQVRCLRP